MDSSLVRVERTLSPWLFLSHWLRLLGVADVLERNARFLQRLNVILRYQEPIVTEAAPCSGHMEESNNRSQPVFVLRYPNEKRVGHLKRRWRCLRRS